MRKLSVLVKLVEKSNSANFTMLEETVLGYEGVTTPPDIINHLQQF
jgi:hypothetical protein